MKLFKNIKRTFSGDFVFYILAVSFLPYFIDFCLYRFFIKNEILQKNESFSTFVLNYRSSLKEFEVELLIGGAILIVLMHMLRRIYDLIDCIIEKMLRKIRQKQDGEDDPLG